MPAAPSLLIIGAGALGRRVGRCWLSRAARAVVLAETRTVGRHEALLADGVRTRLRADAEPAPRPFLLLAVPLGAAPDYLAEARRAVRLWDGAGSLVMISSTAVYAESGGGPCSEQAPLAAGERARRLLEAERPVLDAGGMVLRLAGLYDAERGPHRVFLRQASSPRRPDGLLNLLHYDDAASLCLAALGRGERGMVYLGCDGQPLSRAELVALAVGSGLFGPDALRCSFEGTSGPVGRRCENSLTRARLGWRPHYRSFGQWLAERAGRPQPSSPPAVG